jgi:hypothetical protein
MTTHRTTKALRTALAAALLLLPTATAVPLMPTTLPPMPFAPRFPDCVQKLDSHATDWSRMDDGTYVTLTTFTGVACLASPPADPSSPSAAATAVYEGSCQVAVSQRTHEEGYSVNLLVFTLHSESASVEITSRVSCSGNAVLTVTYRGGLGLRYGRSSAGAAGFGVGGTSVESKVVQQQGQGCSYFGTGLPNTPLNENCQEVYAVPGSYAATLHDSVPTAADVCVPVDWHNDLAGVGTILSAAGSDLPCNMGIPIKRIDVSQFGFQ